MNKSKPTKQKKHTHLEICTCYEPQQDVKAYVNSRNPQTKGEARSIAAAYHARKAEEKECPRCGHKKPYFCWHCHVWCQPKAETGWAERFDKEFEELHSDYWKRQIKAFTAKELERQRAEISWLDFDGYHSHYINGNHWLCKGNHRECAECQQAIQEEEHHHHLKYYKNEDGLEYMMCLICKEAYPVSDEQPEAE